MAHSESNYSARYCTNCGALLQKVGSKWKCPNHGVRDRNNGVTTTKPGK